MARAQITRTILVGQRGSMPISAEDGHGFEIVEADEADIAECCTALARNIDRAVVVKGKISSGKLLSALLAGGRTSQRLSHVYVIDSPAQPGRALIVTDAGVNIRPDLDVKVEIVNNAVSLANSLGYDRPCVALLSAVETVNPAIPSTVDAAAIRTMAESGKFPSARVDGPMSMDVAISRRAADAKKMAGPVAGMADVLVLPDIDSGNTAAKALIGADGRAMGVIYGAFVPIAFPSRGDSEATRRDSLLLAAALASQSHCDLRS